MKILHIMATENALPHAENIVLGLQAHGFEQSVAAPGASPHNRAFEKARLRLSPHIFDGPKFMQKKLLRSLVTREKPVFIHCWTAQGAEFAGDALHKEAKKPVLTGWFGTAFDTDAFKYCNKLVGASRSAVRQITQKNTLKKNTQFIPKPPDIIAQVPIDRASLSTPREAKVMLVFARSLPGRDIEPLLEALEKLPQWIGWFAGTGVWRHELESRARKHNLLDRVRFLKQRKDRGGLLRAADVCVVPARNDPFGTIMLESWAAGTPVIACADATNLIEDGVTGLSIDAGDADALIAALLRATENDHLRRTLIAQSYAAYIKDYTRDAVLRQWASFFKS